MGLGLDLGGAKLDVGAAQNNLVELQEFPIKASH